MIQIHILDFIVKGNDKMAAFFITKKLRKRLIVCLIGITVMISAFIVLSGIKEDDHIEYNGKSYSVRADSLEDHKRFALQFGLTLSTNPAMIQKVRIPEKFNKVYTDYNEMQKNSGFDLLPYCGQKCTLYTYEIISAPYNKTAVLNLIVFDNKIIGADICDTVSGGKMRSVFS